jgi:hypothetical protein
LRLLAPDGSTLTEANDFPIGPLLPPSTWNEDDRKPGYFALRLPTDLPAGHYPLEITLYDPNTLETIPYTTPDTATSASSTNGTNDEPTTQSLTLAELQVGDTMELLSPIAQ